MKYIREVAGYMHTNQRRNTQTRKIIFFSPNVEIQYYRDNWLQHLQIIEDSRVPKDA
jgi:hypothetical protein